jgi:prevent-host-death family protein
MAYTVQQARSRLSRLLNEAEEGKDVVIARGNRPAMRIVPVEVPTAVGGKRILGQYAGLCQYTDEIFKPLETDEELREYGFDILVDAKVAPEEVA